MAPPAGKMPYDPPPPLIVGLFVDRESFCGQPAPALATVWGAVSKARHCFPFRQSSSGLAFGRKLVQRQVTSALTAFMSNWSHCAALAQKLLILVSVG